MSPFQGSIASILTDIAQQHATPKDCKQDERFIRWQRYAKSKRFAYEIIEAHFAARAVEQKECARYF